MMQSDNSGFLPLVSVIMPVYNGEKTIQLAINSLFAQTYKNWICIIVDDASNDKTSEVLAGFKNNRKFRIITLRHNMGRGYARQMALDNAEGDLVAFLDADDFYHPAKLSRQVKFLKENPDVSLVSCGQGSVDLQYKLRSVRGKGNGSVTEFNPFKGLNGSFAGSMIRLSEARDFSYNYKLKAAEDKDFFWRLLPGKIISVEDAVLYYYYEIGQITSEKIRRYLLATLKFEFYYFNVNPLYSIRSQFLTLAKLIIYPVLICLYNVDYVVKRRGNDPSIEEIADYEKALKQIGNDGQ